jgi:glycogen(starch) synthase
MEEAKNISPLKVLMTADTVGGVWTYTVELCKALSKQNIHFHLVTLGARMQPWQEKEIGALDHVTVYETDYLLEWMENPWDDLEESGAYLLLLQKAIQADVIHLNGYVYGALDWEVPVVMVAHSDVFSWWRAVKKGNPGSNWDTYFTKVKKGLSEANHIIAPSYAMMDELSDIYALKKNHSIVYNSRSSALFNPGIKEKTIFCMGRIWDEAKNVRLLVDAAPKIPYPIKIAGDNQFEGNRIDITNSNVQNLGKLDSLQIAKELSSASIYVLPAKYEPFGLSILEAALSGCALVLGDIPSLREIWEDNALYVDTENAEELVNTINDLMSDQHKLQQLSEKAWKRAQQFSTEKMAKQYTNLYSQLVQHHEQLVTKKIL